MSDPYTGGCACGAVRYKSDEPVFQNHCQCLDCQHRSGTATIYLTFADRTRRRGSRRSNAIRHHRRQRQCENHAFCPTCGSPVYLSFSAMPDLFTIHAASLDDPGRFQPQAVTYGMRGHGWDALDPAIPKFEKMPPM